MESSQATVEADRLEPCPTCGWLHYPDDTEACLGRPADEWWAGEDDERMEG